MLLTQPHAPLAGPNPSIWMTPTRIGQFNLHLWGHSGLFPYFQSNFPVQVAQLLSDSTDMCPNDGFSKVRKVPTSIFLYFPRGILGSLLSLFSVFYLGFLGSARPLFRQFSV